MRLPKRAILAPYLLAVSQALSAAPGLQTAGGGQALVRPSPRIALGPGEGFFPGSADAGIVLSGSISVHRAGEYRFFVGSGDLTVGGQAAGAGPVRIGAGTQRFEYRLDRPPASGRFSVEWQGPGFAREPIPARLLSHVPMEGRSWNGRALFEDLGCSNCHLSESESIQQRPGPLLTGVGGRVRRAWIGHWLDSPAAVRPWATMPEMLTRSERRDVTAFLATQVSDTVDSPRVAGAHEERGRTTFQSFGCAACHSRELPLDGLGSKMSVARIRQYLLDPIRYSPDGRMPAFHLDETEALELAAFLSLSRSPALERETRPGDAVQGRMLVQSSGCLACHELDGLRSDTEAPPLSSLAEFRGCLAESVPAGLPRYRLSEPQRRALRDFVAGYKAVPDQVPAPTYDLPRRLAQFRCGACHEIDGQAPTGPIAESAPSLTGVGDKLRTDSIEDAIASENSVLDWQELRMPSFGPSHAAWLADALAKASGVDPDRPADRPADGEAQAGHALLGVDAAQGGMGCIGCHGWGRYPPLGENGPNLALTGRRLRWPWFARWMRDPGRILPGTSMPRYFGGSDDPRAAGSIAALWAAFVSAPALPPPAGFEAADAELGSEAMPVPSDKPVVIRWDLPEATPAAIAVGLPGGLSYCFDAGESRLRYAWRGGFLDMSRTLLTKKNRETNLTETARIVGEVFFREGSFPIRVGDRARIPQRRFRGYRLVEGTPEFRYEVEGVPVRERILASGTALVRQFRLHGVKEPMWFVPAEAAGVEIESTLDEFSIPVGDVVTFEVRVVSQQ